MNQPEPSAEPPGKLQAILQGAAERTQKAIESGASVIRSQWGRIPLFPALRTSEQHDDQPRDETHYFLVPTPFVEAGYALHSSRRVPPGFAKSNDLPRLRVFHLPGPGADQTLERLVIEATKSAQLPIEGEDDDAIAVRLQRVADEIDAQTVKVTGGLLVIGGVVALANPLVGAGIAAKAILPAAGSIFSRELLKGAGTRLSRWQAGRRSAKQEKEATKEVRSVPVVSFVNPLLAGLERALKTSAHEYDPSLDCQLQEVVVEGWNSDEILKLTAQAIVDVFDDTAQKKQVAEGFRLGAEDRAWLEQLRAYASDPQ